MKTLRVLPLSAAAALVLLSLPRAARAIAVPDSGSCNGSTLDCFTIVNDETSDQDPTHSSAVKGWSDFYTRGVFGHSGFASGVHGESTYNAGVLGTGNIGVKGEVSGSSYAAIYGNVTSGTAWAGYFTAKVRATQFVTASDARLKKDIHDAPYGLDHVLKLHPVTYTWKEGVDKGAQLGLIAQEVRQIVPEVVSADATTGLLSVDYQALVPLLIKATQDQEKVIHRQEARIASLERSHGRLLSSVFSGGIEPVVLASLPLGLIAVLRRRRGKKG